MERARIKFAVGVALITGVALNVLWPGRILAGTMLVTPKAESAAGEDGYPESRFGFPPPKVDTGITRGYASRAVVDMESSDESGPEGGTAPAERRPAGLSESPPPPSKEFEPKVLRDPNPPTSDPKIQASSIARKGVQEVALIAGDLGFFPKTVFVTRDVPVRMFVTGASKNTLCIMMDSFQVRKQVRSQKIEEITFTPSLPGKYRFYCPVNGMEGTMVVKEFAVNHGSGE